jgi:hypothetical protein
VGSGPGRLPVRSKAIAAGDRRWPTTSTEGWRDVLLVAAPIAVALPGELWLVAGVLVWPLGAWGWTAVRDVPRAARPRVFARTAGGATLVAVALLATSALLFTTNGTTRAFQSLAAQLAAGVSLLGGLLSGVIALVLRRATHPPDGPAEPEHDEAPSRRGEHDR